MSTAPVPNPTLDAARLLEQSQQNLDALRVLLAKLRIDVDAAASGGGAPSGAAGGDLAGTYPNPDIGTGVIVNTDVSATAAIDASKIADGTVSSAEFQYINSLSSNAQTQLDAKQPVDADLTQIATQANVRGDILITDATPEWVRLGKGTTGQVLTSDGTDVAWAAAAGGSSESLVAAINLLTNGRPTSVVTPWVPANTGVTVTLATVDGESVISAATTGTNPSGCQHLFTAAAAVYSGGVWVKVDAGTAPITISLGAGIDTSITATTAWQFVRVDNITHTAGTRGLVIFQTDTGSRTIYVKMAGVVQSSTYPGVVALVKGDVGLGNVTNDAQLKASDLDTDGTLAANSATKVPAQSAVKTYADTKATDSLAAHLAGTESITGTKTFSAAVTGSSGFLGPNGSAGAPTYSFTSAATTGIYQSSGLKFAVSGTLYATINTTAFTMTGNVNATGGVYSGIGSTGAAVTLTGATPTNYEITAASARMNFFQTAWGLSTTPVIRLSDPQRLVSGGSPFTLHAWDDAVSDYNSINEGDTALGAWHDPMGGDGPGGPNALLKTTGGVWQIARLRNAPGVSAASGGWHAVLISTGGY